MAGIVEIIREWVRAEGAEHITHAFMPPNGDGTSVSVDGYVDLKALTSAVLELAAQEAEKAGRCPKHIGLNKYGPCGEPHCDASYNAAIAIRKLKGE